MNSSDRTSVLVFFVGCVLAAYVMRSTTDPLGDERRELIGAAFMEGYREQKRRRREEMSTEARRRALDAHFNTPRTGGGAPVVF